MPLFEYVCRECGRKTEVLVREGITPRCGQCGSTRLEKQLGRIMPKIAAPAASACGGCCEAAAGCPMRGACMD